MESENTEFMQIQQSIADSDSWIIDGNCISSLEARWSRADVALYFNYPWYICLFRLMKRQFEDRKNIDDRADNCPERLTLRLLKYMFQFNQKVRQQIEQFEGKYPDVISHEIKSNMDLVNIGSKLSKHLIVN